MSPPKLTADTPVFDVLHPVFIGVLVFSRIELDIVCHYRFQRRFSKVFHFQEPLHGEFRLNGYVGTFGETYFIGVRLCLFHQSGSSEVFLNLFADVEAVHADV